MKDTYPSKVITDSIEETKAFCVMPWVHVYGAELGKVKACCVGNIPFGNLNKENISSVWNGKAIRDFRLKLLRDEPDNRCKVCYKRELAGKDSLRKINNLKFKKHLPKILQTSKTGHYEGKPVYWDLRFSNVCNLRCRSCWHGNSSKWFEDAKALNRNLGEKSLIRHVHNFSELAQQLNEFLPDIEEVYFAGGEPLIMDEHLRILEILVEQKKFDARLSYNTNFTVLKHKDKKILDLWKQFDSVEIAASLDATAKRGEYIRKDLVWDRIIENRKLLSQECPKVKFHINPTLSIFNLLHVPDFHKEWVEKGFIGISEIKINILERPFHMNIKALPENLKKQAKKRYKDHILWLSKQNLSKNELTTLIEEFESCIKFMEQEDLSKHFKKFIEETKTLDEIRGENFVTIFPELASEFRN